MPTGYTADIAKGITFKQYAFTCARAMGALIMMRDDPSDAPIPDSFEPSDHHVKQLEKLLKERVEVQALTFDAADLRAAAAYSAEVEMCEDQIRKNAELKIRYEAMLQKVRQWEPPTPDHIGFKTFMSEQITESIRFDCNSDYWIERRPIRISGAAWRIQELNRIEKDIQYHQEQNRDEIKRTSDRTAWVKALRESLTFVE